MNAVDRAATRNSVIPADLIHRFRHDPLFHKLVHILLGVLQSEPPISGADIREASLVAVELRREIEIQERMREPFEMVIPKQGEPGEV